MHASGVSSAQTISTGTSGSWGPVGVAPVAGAPVGAGRGQPDLGRPAAAPCLDRRSHDAVLEGRRYSGSTFGTAASSWLLRLSTVIGPEWVCVAVIMMCAAGTPVSASIRRRARAVMPLLT